MKLLTKNILLFFSFFLQATVAEVTTVLEVSVSQMQLSVLLAISVLRRPLTPLYVQVEPTNHRLVSGHVILALQGTIVTG